MEPELRSLMLMYSKAQATGKVSANFTRRLKKAHREGSVTDAMMTDILNSIRPKKVDPRTRQLLEQTGLTFLERARPLSLVDQKVKRPYLKAYTFSSLNAPKSELVYVPVDRLFKAVVQLKVAAPGAASWPNPVAELVPFKPRLNQGDVQRIKLWFEAYQKYQALPAASKTKLAKFDLYLYPSAIVDYDSTFLGALMSVAGAVVTPVHDAVKWVGENLFFTQVILMIVRNLVCIAMVFVILSYVDTPISMLTFAVEMLFGFFLQNVWTHVYPYIKESGFLDAHWRQLGPLGESLSNFFSKINTTINLTGIIPPELQAAGFYTVAAQFLTGGSGWWSMLAHGGILTTAGSLWGLNTLFEAWKGAVYEHARILWNATSKMEGHTLSALLAVQVPKLICGLMGLSSNVPGQTSVCDKLMNLVSYVLSLRSIGSMIWDMMSDMYLSVEIYRRARNKSLTWNWLKQHRESSACIRALVNTKEWADEANRPKNQQYPQQRKADWKDGKMRKGFDPSQASDSTYYAAEEARAKSRVEESQTLTKIREKLIRERDQRVAQSILPKPIAEQVLPAVPYAEVLKRQPRSMEKQLKLIKMFLSGSPGKQHIGKGLLKRLAPNYGPAQTLLEQVKAQAGWTG